MYGIKVMRKTRNILSKIFVVAIAACALYTADSYAATKTTKSKTKSTTSSTKTVVVDNKTSQFNEVFSDLGAKTADTTSSDLADRVRRQRALLDNKGKAPSDGGKSSSGVTGANACDANLRKCMAEKCGADFTKCSKDSTTIWGEKMDSCRRKTECSGHEYSLLAPEILADRDFNERMTYYNSVISCGNRYNACVFAECGTTLEKCLSKSDGDRAISKCGTIAKECKEQDSGMASRIMTVFGDLRTIAQAQAEKDEKRLYELRDLMRTQCNRLGAMFDERTLDCVYTVNFFAGDNTSTPTSSKKLYAGDSFQCNANWFGVDVTTFKENAYRLTRSQTAASSAMLGAGVGTAAGLLSSGAIGRALETQKAEKAAKEECQKSGGTWKKGECTDIDPELACTNAGGTWTNNQCSQTTSVQTGGNGGSGEAPQPNPEQECTAKGLKYSDGQCTQECIDTAKTYDPSTDTCKDLDQLIGETKCLGADNMQCSSASDYCTWLKNAKKCVVKGTEDQYEDVYTPTQQEEISHNCSDYVDESSCETEFDKCVWIPENSDEPNPEQGTCENRPTYTPAAGGDERRARTPNPQDETAQVNINLKALTSANTPVQGYLRCKYNNKNKEDKTTKEGVLSLKKIPGNAECTIGTSAPTCSPMKKTAKEFSAMQSVTMVCRKVDDCLAKFGKWENNECTGGDALIKLTLGVKGPSNINLKKLDITCDNNAGRKSPYTYSDKVLIYDVPASINCTVKADYCGPYKKTVAELDNMQKANTPINLTCSNITLKWSDILSKVKNATMTKVECDSKTLESSSSPAITVSANANCKISYTDPDGKRYSVSKITPYRIKTEDGPVVNGSKKK